MKSHSKTTNQSFGLLKGKLLYKILVLLLVFSLVITSFYYYNERPSTLNNQPVYVPVILPSHINLRSTNQEQPQKQTDQIVITTACNSAYFFPLENLVGSVHFWTPKTKVIVYDLGLRPKEIDAIHTWCNVEYRKFNFSMHPMHVKYIGEFAWKPIIISTELENYPIVFWFDAGAELRKPLDRLVDIVKRDGYWMHGWDKLCRLIHPGMLEHFNVTKTSPVCTHSPPFKMNEANSMGFKQGSNFSRTVLPEVLECALLKACIAPEGSGTFNHRFDQAAFSIAAATHNYTLQKGIDVRCCDNKKVPANETIETDIQLMLRRTMSPKPYAKYVLWRNEATGECKKNQRSTWESWNAEEKKAIPERSPS